MYIAYFHVLFLLVAMFSDNHKRSIIVPNRMGSSIIQFQHVNLRAVTHKIPSPMFKRILACLAKSPKKVPSTIILMQWGRRWEFRVLSNRRGTKILKMYILSQPSNSNNFSLEEAFFWFDMATKSNHPPPSPTIWNGVQSEG